MGVVPFMSVPVSASPDCVVVSDGDTISTSQTCAQWNGGNVVVAVGGTLSGYSPAVTVVSGDNVGTLTNDGLILGSTGAFFSSGSIAAILNNGTITTTSSTAIFNNSAIGIITNSGMISSSTNVAISNYGTLNTISNSGTITASNSYAIINQIGRQLDLINNSSLISGTRGIHNEGTIGQITNSGTIVGTGSYAIYNKSGADMTIVNSGTIAGNIGYDDTIIGSITPGAFSIAGSEDDTHYGVLTGKGGSTNANNIGNIVHSFADLHFTSDYLLLNDNINVTGHTVVNSGATLKLVNGLSITGNYTQTGGGLVVQAASSSQFGSLAVSGNAAISNTSLVMSGNNLSVGDTYTIVGAGGTGTYAISTVSVVGTSGLGATTATVGKDLVVTITKQSGGGYQVIGAPTGGVGSSFGATLDQINNSSSPQAVAFQNNVLAAINSLPSSQQGSAIKKLAPASAANNVQVLNQASTVIQGAVQGHQDLAMSGGSDGTTGVAAGGDTKYSALWGQVLGGSAHLEGNSDQDGFSSKSFGLTTGFDHFVTPDLLAGAAVSWLRSWTDGSNDSSGSSNKIDSYQLTLYGSWRQDRLTVDGQVGAGWNHFDQKRQIDFLGSTASADYDGQQYSASSRVGYDFTLGDSTTLTPFAGLRWIHARNEAYDETGAGSANNSVDSLNTDSVTHEIGAKAAWQFETDMGTVSPEVSAAWVHDYTSSAIDTTGRIGGTAFSVQSERLPSDGARIGVALGLDMVEGARLRVEYDGELRSGYQSQTGTVRAAWDF
jgi:outer membrane autotransporter protein